jgi:hypothetical protein
VELLLCWYRDFSHQDGNLFYGKNPRVLQFLVSSSDSSSLYEAAIHDRFYISRRLLIGENPMNYLIGEKNIKLIISWLIRRYRRAAFPDEFNERLRPALKKVQEIAAKKGKYVSGIYILVEDREMPANEPYRVMIKATVPVKDWDSPKIREECHSCITGIVGAIVGKCSSSICIGNGDDDGFEVVSEADFSIDDLRLFKRWDYDHISLKSDPMGIMGPE